MKTCFCSNPSVCTSFLSSSFGYPCTWMISQCITIYLTQIVLGAEKLTWEMSVRRQMLGSRGWACCLLAFASQSLFCSCGIYKSTFVRRSSSKCIRNVALWVKCIVMFRFVHNGMWYFCHHEWSNFVNKLVTFHNLEIQVQMASDAVFHVQHTRAACKAVFLLPWTDQGFHCASCQLHEAADPLATATRKSL